MFRSQFSIHDAAAQGNIEAVKQHLATGTYVNAKGKLSTSPLSLGWTPLHHAAEEGHKETAKLLIGNGADVNAKDEILGRTPLDEAIRLKHPETADLLRKHGGKTAEELKAEGK